MSLPLPERSIRDIGAAIPSLVATALLALAAGPVAAASAPVGSASVTAACALPPPGLVAWWAGENDALDTYIAHPGSLLHGLGFAPGRVGQAFSVDGVDDAMAVGMVGAVGVAEDSPFSIAAWINAADPGAAGLHVIAANYMGEGGGTGNFSTYLLLTAGQLSFAVNERQIQGISADTPITSGWHFVSATYDGTTLAVYVDASLRTSVSRNFSGASGNTRGWSVGNFSEETNAAHGYSSPFNGLVDEVTIFDRALAPSDIAAIYAADSAGLCRPSLFADGFE